MPATASPIQEFIQTYLALDQRNRDLRRQNVEEVTSRTTQFTAALQIARMTQDPAKQQELIQYLGPQMGPRGIETLTQLLTMTAPSREAQVEGAIQRNAGRQSPGDQARLDAEAAAAALTGQNRGALAGSDVTASTLQGITETGIPEDWRQSFGLRFFTGQTPGAYSLDRAQAGLTPEEQVNAARYGLNLAINPIQERQFGLQERGQSLDYSIGMANNALGWAGNRFQWAQLGVNSSMAEAELGVRMREANLQATARGDQNAQEDLNGLRQTLDVIQQGRLSEGQRVLYYNIARQHAARLRSKGYAVPDFDPTQAAQNSYTPSLRNNTFGTGRGGTFGLTYPNPNTQFGARPAQSFGLGWSP